MDFKKIEKKWNKKWHEDKLYSFNKERIDKKYYLLEMFSYPSNDKLHIGHWWNFGLSDSYGRYKMMKGYELFHPMGFDSFGLPAENYAIKTGIHPKDSTYNNIKLMEEQIKGMGGTFDWDYEIKTSDPSYYKWTQWLFIQLYKKGLAYQKYSPVNWCPSCNTVLANEQVVDGKCERCKSEVTHKKLTQWFLKITDYADRLLDGLDSLDWPEKTKSLQKNWIGKSKGTNVTFKTENNEDISTFTSRVDTLHGVTWVVLAPEHDLVEKVVKPENKKAADEYITAALKLNDVERQNTVKEKTGVFTGSYAINPINNTKVPIYIGDYVVSSYGTGAVMGVPAHDERDFEFAKKYNLDIKQVIKPKNEDSDLPYTGEGILINSDKHTGLSSFDAREKITKDLENINQGSFSTNYRIRDWSVSRQRYWGAPIPIIHCDKCGAVPVEEKDLPVELPYDVDWSPTGRSPLSKNEEYMNTKCPKCQRDAKRDPDTLDTFVCSSWYFLRYPNAGDTEKIIDKDFTNKLLPVDKYVGGIEHATGHLLYSRFVTKFLHDNGYLNFEEPFLSLVNQGMILGSDGFKMSKSRGNTVNPDAIIKNYNSDVLRLYLMFGFNYIDGGPWDENGIKPMDNFMKKVYQLIKKTKTLSENTKIKSAKTKLDEEMEYRLHYTIKEVDKNFDRFSFNTSIARIMELVNMFSKYINQKELNLKIVKQVANDLIKLLAPAAPHLAEELWEIMGNDYSVFSHDYPTFNPDKLVKSSIEIVVQVNSKIADRIKIDLNETKEQIVEKVLKLPKVSSKIGDKSIVKTIYVQKKLINLIVK